MNPWVIGGAAAVLATKRGREVVRKGVVYGLAGALTAGDAVLAAARGVTHTAGEAATATGERISHAASDVKHGAERLAGGGVTNEQGGHGEEEESKPKGKRAGSKANEPKG